MTGFDDGEMPHWTLAEHLARGATAIRDIERDDRSAEPPPVCHHFWADSKDDEEFEETVLGRRFTHLVKEFAKLGLTFEADRLEAWETAQPDQAWLTTTVPAVFNLAAHCGLSGYQGWTWEPNNGQPIGACDFQVINNRSEVTD